MRYIVTFHLLTDSLTHNHKIALLFRTTNRNLNFVFFIVSVSVYFSKTETIIKNRLVVVFFVQKQHCNVIKRSRCGVLALPGNKQHQQPAAAAVER